MGKAIRGGDIVPSEIRQLSFSPAEVVQAVKEYYRRSGQPLPGGSIVSCGGEAEAGLVRFRITVMLDPVKEKNATQPGKPIRQEVVIEGPALAAALILSCRDRRIPLSSHANKSLRSIGDQVCLIATINPKQSELTPENLRL